MTATQYDRIASIRSYATDTLGKAFVDVVSKAHANRINIDSVITIRLANNTSLSNVLAFNIKLDSFVWMISSYHTVDSNTIKVSITSDDKYVTYTISLFI